MKKLEARIDAWIGRRRGVVVTVAAMLGVIFLPLVPFTPQCRAPDGNWGLLGAFYMAPAYRRHVTYYFRMFDVPYLQVGGVVLIPSWIWLSGGPDDELINASNKPYLDLLTKGWDDRPDLPEHVKALMKESRATYGHLEDTCELVRAVAIEGW
jgi:hypothetical protein